MSKHPGPIHEHDNDVPLVRVESEPQPGSSSLGWMGLSGDRSDQRQSERAPYLNSRTASERSSLFAHLPRSPSRLRRSGSLTSLPVHAETHAETAHVDLTNSSDSHHGHEHTTSPTSASLQNVRNALHRIGHSDSHQGRLNRADSPHNSPGHDPAPLRLFWPLRRFHSRDEPLFVPIDPYRFKLHLFSSEDLQEQLQRRRAAFSNLCTVLRHVVVQTYRHLLLRIPSMYFTRVSRLFEEAEVTRPEIQRMIDGVAQGLNLTHDWTPPNVSPALARFKTNWEEFVDIVIQEWKTLNVVSALLLSALLTIFQIDDANNNPVTRTISLVSLICASWSLIYGGIYIMRFRTMRTMYKASSFAQEAQTTKTNIFWNVWVLLALPAVWLAWSMITFFAAILAFVWTSGDAKDDPELPQRRVELVPRLIVTALFTLGLVYFVLVLNSFKAYGAPRLPKPQIRPQGDSGQAGPNVEVGSLHLNLNERSDGVRCEDGYTASNVPRSKVDLEKCDLQQAESERTTTGRHSPGLGGLGL